ncbi:hypothetical protein K438DRAFT_2001434 [Mycena galopus ATCC 62051]|nr:hypothetical protein K438DRAFT_2001434 [Mycena galopus ATCC 62051]
MESTVSCRKDLKDLVLDAIDAQVAQSPFDLAAPSIAKHIWVQLESLPAHQVEEFLNYLTCIVHAKELIIKHAIHSPFSSSSLTRAKSVVYFWVAALQRSLEPAEFVAWFGRVFRPMIETAENTIKAEARGPDDATKEDTTKDVEAKQPPAKRQRTEHRGEIQERVVGGLSSNMGYILPTLYGAVGSSGEGQASASQVVLVARAQPEVLGRVRQAALSITQTTSAPSSSFAPVLDSKPLRIPGAWPPSPLRTRAACQDSASHFRNSYVRLAKPQHRCPLQN